MFSMDNRVSLIIKGPCKAVKLSLSVINFDCFVFTARKRSLGQGNIFRSVCQEFCPQGGMHGKGGHAWWGACVGGMCGREACVVGGCAWWGVCMAGGHAWQGGMHHRGCVVGGHAWQIPQDTVNERVVRTLLECIPVICLILVQML